MDLWFILTGMISFLYYFYNFTRKEEMVLSDKGLAHLKVLMKDLMVYQEE